MAYESTDHAGRAGAADRQAAVLAFLLKDPTRASSMSDIHGGVWRIATQKQIRSAIEQLRRRGLVKRVSGGGRAPESTWQAIVEPAREVG